VRLQPGAGRPLTVAHRSLHHVATGRSRPVCCGVSYAGPGLWRVFCDDLGGCVEKPRGSSAQSGSPSLA